MIINDYSLISYPVFLSCILACLFACLLAWLVWAIGRTGRSGPWGSVGGGGGSALFGDGPFVAVAVWSPGVPVGGEMEEETGRREEERWV